MVGRTSTFGAAVITLGGGVGSTCVGAGLMFGTGVGSGLSSFFGKGLMSSGAGFIFSTGLGGSGVATGSGGLGFTISTVSRSGIFLVTSNLKLGTTTKNKICSRMEQVTAQIIVLSFKEEFLMVMFKIKKVI